MFVTGSIQISRAFDNELTGPILNNSGIYILLCNSHVNQKSKPVFQLLDDSDENNNLEEEVKQRDYPYQEQLMVLWEETQKKDQVNKKVIG